MDCKQAFFELNVRDPAAPADGVLAAHLEACAACRHRAKSQDAADNALARAMTAVPVPDGLRDRLHRDLREHTRTRSRSRLLRLASAAAALLLAVGLGLGYRAARRAPLDLDQLVLKGDFQFENPDESARQWLAEQRLPERLPLPFNMALLMHRGTERVQGRDVPVMVFHDNRDPHTPRMAKLYFFRDDQFTRLEALRATQSSYFQTKILRDEVESPGLSFVVVYTGQTENDLKPFLRVLQSA